MPKPSIQNTDCALLVMSCDAYSDLWRPFLALLHRHWPDCPFPVYLGTGQLGCDDADVTVLRSDGGRDWSRCALDYLDQLPQAYILVMLDDFFLRRQVPTAEILHCLRFAQSTNSTQVRLIPRPPPTDRLAGESLIGECAAGSPYRLAAQAAIWNRAALHAFLRPGESIWAFEHQGNARALEQPHGFYSVWRPVLPYQGCLAHHVVEKGKWLPHEKWIFARQNIDCDFSRRATLPLAQTVFYHTVQLLDRSLDVLSWQNKARIKTGLKRILRPLMHRQFSRMGGTTPPDS
jgi:hypothetical protein